MSKARRHDLQATLDHITALLEKQDLVAGLVHKQHQPRQELVESLVARQQSTELRREVNALHPADIAFVLERLPPGRRLQVWDLVDSAHDGAVLLEASDAVRERLIADMDQGEIVQAAEGLDSDEIADLVPDLPREVVPELLRRLDRRGREEVRSALAFPEGSVGALMDFDITAVREDVALDVVLRYLRRRGRLSDNSGLLMVVDRDGVLKGTLALEALVTHEAETPVAALMEREPVTFHTTDEAVEAARAFDRYDLITAPVVNVHHRLVGCLKVEDMVDLLREHSQKEFLAQAGLREDEDFYAPVWRTARNRWGWLALNLLTAFIASRVIGQFEGTIEKVVALAALMPIVASVGGNTGHQTLALMIQGLALKQITPHSFRHLLARETGVSLVNGLIWGAVMGGFTWLLYGRAELAAIMLAAMVLNLVLAALAGAYIPLTLKRFGRDPVLGSSVFLTGLTDSMGFLIFLGLAALFLPV